MYVKEVLVFAVLHVFFICEQGKFVQVGSAVVRAEAPAVSALIAHVVHMDDLVLLHARDTDSDVRPVGAYFHTVLADALTAEAPPALLSVLSRVCKVSSSIIHGFFVCL